MFDHLGFTSSNLERSIRFYTAALAPLGHDVTSSDESSAGFGSGGSTPLWIYAGAKTTRRGVHLAFTAADRKAVDQFHAAGLKCGGTDNGAPGLRTDYSSKYYAAFLLDPDGNNVEAVCLR